MRMVAFVLFALAGLIGLTLTHWAHDVTGAGSDVRSESAKAWASGFGPFLAAVGVLGALIAAVLGFR